MEPKHHPIEKQNHLPNLGSMLIFQGVYRCPRNPKKQFQQNNLKVIKPYCPPPANDLSGEVVTQKILHLGF